MHKKTSLLPQCTNFNFGIFSSAVFFSSLRWIYTEIAAYIRGSSLQWTSRNNINFENNSNRPPLEVIHRANNLLFSRFPKHSKEVSLWSDNCFCSIYFFLRSLYSSLSYIDRSISSLCVQIASRWLNNFFSFLLFFVITTLASWICSDKNGIEKWTNKMKCFFIFVSNRCEILLSIRL